jgi:hypothetical protein
MAPSDNISNNTNIVVDKDKTIKTKTEVTTETEEETTKNEGTE